MNRKPKPPAALWAIEARKAAGYTSADKAADAAGMPRPWLRSLEAGDIRKPNSDRIARLAGLYSPDPPDLEAMPDPAVDLTPEERAFVRGFIAGVRAAPTLAAPAPPLEEATAWARSADSASRSPDVRRVRHRE